MAHVEDLCAALCPNRSFGGATMTGALWNMALPTWTASACRCGCIASRCDKMARPVPWVIGQLLACAVLSQQPMLTTRSALTITITVNANHAVITRERQVGVSKPFEVAAKRACAIGFPRIARRRLSSNHTVGRHRNRLACDLKARSTLREKTARTVRMG